MPAPNHMRGLDGIGHDARVALVEEDPELEYAPVVLGDAAVSEVEAQEICGIVTQRREVVGRSALRTGAAVVGPRRLAG